MFTSEGFNGLPTVLKDNANDQIKTIFECIEISLTNKFNFGCVGIFYGLNIFYLMESIPVSVYITQFVIFKGHFFRQFSGIAYPPPGKFLLLQQLYESIDSAHIKIARNRVVLRL